jgi:hypothetical protein
MMTPMLGKHMKALQDPDLSADQRQFLNELRGVRHIVISKCHGGFGLSAQAVKLYLKLKGQQCWIEKSQYGTDHVWLVPKHQRVEYDVAPEKWHSMTQAERQQHNTLCDQQLFSERAIDRDDPVLVQAVRELGSKRASGRFAELNIVEIPADVEWQIEEYDGAEWIAEKHRVWR